MNPLEMLAQQAAQKQAPQQQPPQISAHQAAAALHRFSVIRSSLEDVVKDPRLGVENIRPKLLDAASKILASKAMALPELMNEINQLPDDPVKQKAFTEQIFNQAAKAREAIIQHASALGEGDEDYDHSKYNDHIAAMQQQFNSGR